MVSGVDMVSSVVVEFQWRVIGALTLTFVFKRIELSHTPRRKAKIIGYRKRERYKGAFTKISTINQGTSRRVTTTTRGEFKETVRGRSQLVFEVQDVLILK